MTNGRADAVKKVLAELAAFEIDHQQYFEDAEPQGWYDGALTGKVGCRPLGSFQAL